MSNPLNTEMKENRYLRLDVAVCSNCNLNCIGCLRQAPLCGHNPYPLDKFESDLAHLKSIGIELETITLTGGEPFLNKDLFEYPKIIRKFFPEVLIMIFTNGLYLQNADDSVFREIKESVDLVVFTHYFCSRINYPKVLERLRSFNIRFEEIGEEIGFKRKYKGFMVVQPFCEKAEADPEKIRKSFDRCLCDCLTLYGGKLYFCSAIINYNVLNEKFKTNFCLEAGSDFVDVKDIKTPDDVFSRLGKLKSFCKWCCWGDEKFHPWCKSNRDKGEWIR